MALRTGLARSLISSSPDEQALAQLRQRLDPIAHQVAILSRFSVPNHLYAYCFCEAR